MIVLAILGSLLVYEGLRFMVIRGLRQRWQRSIGDFLRQHAVQLDHFRFICGLSPT